ncbi:MAG: hypothetical protein U0802_16065 [Candidatus Binatia bacterium]
MIDYLRRRLGVAGDPHDPGECFHPFSSGPETACPNPTPGPICDLTICTPNLDRLAREGSPSTAPS